MPNGSDYAELWMRAPEQIGQYLPGPIGTAMAILAATDIAITDTDKTNLVQLLNEASKDYLSDSSNAESMTALNKMIDRLGTGSTNTHLQSIIKGNVESNVAKTQKGNESSNFGDHVKKEQEINAGKGTAGPTQVAKEGIGVPVTQSKNPLSPVQQYDAYGNEIVYRTMSPEQFKQFERTGIMPATTETSVSPVLSYSSKYDGVTVKIVVKSGTFSELEKIGIAANKPASTQFPNMSTQTGKWMNTNTRFKVEGGQMTTQLGQGKGMDIFNKNIVHFEKVK